MQLLTGLAPAGSTPAAPVETSATRRLTEVLAATGDEPHLVLVQGPPGSGRDTAVTTAVAALGLPMERAEQEAGVRRTRPHVLLETARADLGEDDLLALHERCRALPGAATLVVPVHRVDLRLLDEVRRRPGAPRLDLVPVPALREDQLAALATAVLQHPPSQRLLELLRTATGGRAGVAATLLREWVLAGRVVWTREGMGPWEQPVGGASVGARLARLLRDGDGAVDAAAVLAVLAVWQGVVVMWDVPQYLLPPPGMVAEALWEDREELWHQTLVTGLESVLAFGLAVVVGAALGVVIAFSKPLARVLFLILVGSNALPKVALAPLFILWLGIFEASKVALIAFGVFFPVYLNLMAGIRGVDRKLVEVARVYNFSAFTLVRRVLLPATLPAYMVGLRSGLGLGWMFVIAAEFMGASEGLGFLLIDGQMTGRPQVIIGAIILFALFGKATDLLLAAASKRVLFWQDAFDPEARGSIDADDRERH